MTYILSPLQKTIIDIACYIINKEKFTVVGHTNATVFTEDRGTQENKMCCLIYFYFIIRQLCAKESPVLFREMGTENECMQTKMMSTTSKTITTYRHLLYMQVRDNQPTYALIALAATSISVLVRSPGDRVFAARLAGVFQELPENTHCDDVVNMFR